MAHQERSTNLFLEHLPGKRLAAGTILAATAIGLAGCGEKPNPGGEVTATGTTQSQPTTHETTVPLSELEKYAANLTPDKLANMTPDQIVAAATISSTTAKNEKELAKAATIYWKGLLGAGTSAKELKNAFESKGLTVDGYSDMMINGLNGAGGYDTWFKKGFNLGYPNTTSSDGKHANVREYILDEAGRAETYGAYTFDVTLDPASVNYTLDQKTLVYTMRLIDKPVVNGVQPADRLIDVTLVNPHVDEKGNWAINNWSMNDLSYNPGK